MNRVSTAVPKKSKRAKILKSAKGFYGRRKNCKKLALLAVRKSREKRYVGLKLKKRNQRRSWNKLISIWAKLNSTRYSLVIKALLDRYQDRKEIYRVIKSSTDPQASTLLVN